MNHKGAYFGKHYLFVGQYHAESQQDNSRK